MDNTIYQEYNSFKDLIKERDYSRQFDPYKEHMMMNEDQARLALKDHFGYSIGILPKIAIHQMQTQQRISILTSVPFGRMEAMELCIIEGSNFPLNVKENSVI